MDRLNFYYLQRVLESEMDLTQSNALASLKRTRSDVGIVGVHANAAVTPNAPPDLHVLVSGPALASAPDGERIYFATQQNVDCSHDHIGVSTAVAAAPNERWISVIAEYDETLADPVTDGSGATVYTRIYESFNLYVTMAAEKPLGTGLRPALPTDGVLLADILLVFGQVQILIGDIDLTRRQDLVHEQGTSIATFYHGTHGAAIAALFGYVDALSSGGGIAFALDPGGTTWRDASTLAAANVNAAITEIVADLYALAGAARVGAAAHATAGGFCNTANGAIQTQLNAIADAVDGHIGGGAPNHADTAITAAAIAGSPESFAGGTTRDVEVALYGHVNARAEKGSDETITGAWLVRGGSPAGAASTDPENFYFENNPRFRSMLGGTIAPRVIKACVASGLQNGNHWSHAWSGDNTVDLGNVGVTDISMLLEGRGDRRVCVLYNDQATGHPYIGHFDPTYPSAVTSFQLDAAFPAPVGSWYAEGMCSDGTYLYVMFLDNSAPYAHRIQSYDITGTRRTGWPAAGLAITGNGMHPFVGPELIYHHDRIRVVQVDGNGLATKLATANYWHDLASGMSIAIFDADDPTTNIYGDGDAALLAGVPGNYYPFGGLASDGTNVFLTWADSASAVGGLYSAKISDLSGSGLTGFPALNAIAFRSQEIVNDGAVLWAPNWEAPEILCYNLDAEAFNVKDAAAAGKLRFAAFDGLGVWVQDREVSDNVLLAHRIPCSEYEPIASSTQGIATMVRATASFVREDEVAAGSYPTHDETGRMFFDGDSVWMVMQNAHTHVLSGIVRRVPRAGSR